VPRIGTLICLHLFSVSGARCQVIQLPYSLFCLFSCYFSFSSVVSFVHFPCCPFLNTFLLFLFLLSFYLAYVLSPYISIVPSFSISYFISPYISFLFSFLIHPLFFFLLFDLFLSSYLISFFTIVLPLSCSHLLFIFIVVHFLSLCVLSHTFFCMKKGVFCYVTPCGSCKNRRFGGT
jgi:hypothetical protein